jgi:SAM-dependent methyltransferase
MRVATTSQLLDLLDEIFANGTDWTSREGAGHWATVYGRADHPLNSDLPDASLVRWVERGLIPAGDGRTALDIGCGLGRNTRWLSQQRYRATGIDISPYAVAEARLRSAQSRAMFAECDVLREDIPGGPFDLVYDSGCFHHLPPHRRLSYLDALKACLAPGGLFAISTFAPGRMGTDANDLTLLRQGRLEGGIAYGPEDLEEMFAFLEPVENGPMPDAPEGGEPAFSVDFLNVALFRQPSGLF